MNNTSPLEYLASFAVAFIVGAISTVALQKWTTYVRNQSKRV